MWGEKKKTLLYMQSYNPAIPGCTFSKLLSGRQALKQENVGKPCVLANNALPHSLVSLALTFSAVVFYC